MKKHLKDQLPQLLLQNVEKIIQTALIFLSEFEYDLQPRFDVCEITIDNRTNMLIELNYIENAFDTEGFLRSFSTFIAIPYIVRSLKMAVFSIMISTFLLIRQMI